jgi:23S rRNA (cytosine1962-C5)-methyltransferase
METLVLSGRGRRWTESGHPWIFANDLAGAGLAPGSSAAGGLVAVAAPDGRVLGHGLYSEHSKIAVRLVQRGPAAPGADWVAERVRGALALRERHGLLEPDGACRLVSGDADGLPGLVVDRYADVLVLQCGTLAADRLRSEVVAELERRLAFPLRAVLDRSDASVRRLEGLEPRVEWLRGSSAEAVLVRDAGLAYVVDVAAGHKTGHYLDQRDNRIEAARGARGGRVLDVCCYDGLFALRCLLAGAREAWCLDQNQRALERAGANAERNGVAERCRWLRADALSELRVLEQAGERFDIVIVDPPAFAKSKREVEGAVRGYRELNRRALALCTPGGLLVSASCSYNVLPAQFLELLRAAAAECGRRVLLERYAGAAADHPVLLTLPESWYLKCAFLRVC